MGAPAPKPANFAEMVDAWDQPEEFARLVHDYYRSLRADSEPSIDITEPRRREDD